MARHADTEMTNLSYDEMDRLTPKEFIVYAPKHPGALFYGKTKSLDLRWERPIDAARRNIATGKGERV
jgi:hypothetical protein